MTIIQKASAKNRIPINVKSSKHLSVGAHADIQFQPHRLYRFTPAAERLLRDPDIEDAYHRYCQYPRSQAAQVLCDAISHRLPGLGPDVWRQAGVPEDFDFDKLTLSQGAHGLAARRGIANIGEHPTIEHGTPVTEYDQTTLNQ